MNILFIDTYGKHGFIAEQLQDAGHALTVHNQYAPVTPHPNLVYTLSWRHNMDAAELIIADGEVYSTQWPILRERCPRVLSLEQFGIEVIIAALVDDTIFNAGPPVKKGWWRRLWSR